MATVTPHPIVAPPHPPPQRRRGSVLVHLLRPAFELHHPHMSDRIRLESHVGSSAPTAGEVAAQGTGGEHISGTDPRNR